MKLPAGAFAYRHPKGIGAALFAEGIWLLVLGAILYSGGFYWGSSLWVVTALVFWFGYHLQPGAQS